MAIQHKFHIEITADVREEDDHSDALIDAEGVLRNEVETMGRKVNQFLGGRTDVTWKLDWITMTATDGEDVIVESHSY